MVKKVDLLKNEFSIVYTLDPLIRTNSMTKFNGSNFCLVNRKAFIRGEKKTAQGTS
jgi:hypothetical protein